MNSTFFPTKHRYFESVHKSLHKWLRHHGLPTTLSQHSRSSPFNASIITSTYNTKIDSQPDPSNSFKNSCDKVVLHHADHELQHLRIFCPHIYFRGCLATWHSPELFQPLDDTDQTISAIIQHTFPPHLRQKYKWGFNTKFKMPYGVVHLKAKKLWRKGRTIIS